MKIKIFILVLLSITLAIIGFLVIALIDQPTKVPRGGLEMIPPIQTSKPKQVKIKSFWFKAEKDKNLLEQLKTHAPGVETVESQYGLSVTSITNQKNGTEGKYWNYYVDGKHSEKNVSEYITKGGEIIEWRFESINSPLPN